jgi:DNA-binding transcriptional regulator/RsmH inhibitor MraZ
MHENEKINYLAHTTKLLIDLSNMEERKKEYANIKQDVRFLAVDDKIEIWDKTLYEDMLGISGEQNDNLGLDLQNLMTDLQ